MTSRLIDLSHDITAGMQTYPGLPTPIIEDHLSREAALEVYGPGNTFQIGLVTMCTNTGTYLDVPFHRYADGHDLTGLALEQVVAVPAVCLDRTGHSATWGTDAYFTDHPHLSATAAEALVAAGVACVGIDSLNIDGTGTKDRPVHTIVLAAEIPIIEHLTGLEQLPADGFTFTAVPPKIEGAGTFTVRAFATVAA